MGLEVNIEPGDVERLVADAVLNSAIGELVGTAVNESLKSLERGYDNPLQKAISNHVQKVVLDLVSKEYDEKIRAVVRGYLTEDIVGEFIQKGWEACLTRFARG